MEGMSDSGVEVLQYMEMDTVRIDDLVQLAFSFPNTAQAVLGIGGGKVVDAAKYCGFLRKLPFISVPTSASSDGFSSASASLIVGTTQIRTGRDRIWNLCRYRCDKGGTGGISVFWYR